MVVTQLAVALQWKSAAAPSAHFLTAPTLPPRPLADKPSSGVTYQQSYFAQVGAEEDNQH